MSLTIQLNDVLAKRLQRHAEAHYLSAEEMAHTILEEALQGEESGCTPEEVVARAQATPPNPAQIRPATGSLAEALHQATEDPTFDLETWKQAWETVETELKGIAQANDRAEGRG